MTPGLTSIVIPTYNHLQYLRESIGAAEEQTAAVEVLVIDDGSTDGTYEHLQQLPYPWLRTLRQPHRGPSAARNLGIEECRGEYVMFLDADDVIRADKVSRQLEELAHHPEAGWVLCDVQIEDEVKRRTILASAQYDYAHRDLSGWIERQLELANFIPIMAPLVRRSAIGDLRFWDHPDREEDWQFWYKLAGRARVRYVPEVLATYRHRKTGRSRLPKPSRRAILPPPAPPLRLNLGCGTYGTRSWHPMEGLVNLDKSMDWRFEDGLHDFENHSVHGITISHALMYAPLERWPFIFSEFTRVLAEDGIVRITEDDTAHPSSARRGGWQGSEPAVTLTSAELVKAALVRAGLMAYDVTPDETHYADRSLCQAQHGQVPDVFFVEGQKLRGTLFAPHSDDESLFAAFTILRYRPRVVICCPSRDDYGPTEVREAESRDALSILGASLVEQWQGGDLVAQMRAFDARVHPVRVWAPDRFASHRDHVAVANAAREVFGDRVTTYHTYTDEGKVTRGRRVEFEPEWVGAKLRALARYESQIKHPRAHQFFLYDLHEYTGDAA